MFKLKSAEGKTLRNGHFGADHNVCKIPHAQSKTPWKTKALFSATMSPSSRAMIKPILLSLLKLPKCFSVGLGFLHRLCLYKLTRYCEIHPITIFETIDLPSIYFITWSVRWVGYTCTSAIFSECTILLSNGLAPLVTSVQKNFIQICRVEFSFIWNVHSRQASPNSNKQFCLRNSTPSSCGERNLRTNFGNRLAISKPTLRHTI